MGDVYLARHELTGDLVAIKRAREVESLQIASLRREIHALSRLRHPGIVRLVDHGIVDGLPWCALDFVEGETLQAVLHAPQDRSAVEGERPATTATVIASEETAPHREGIPFLPERGGHDESVAPPPSVVAA